MKLPQDFVQKVRLVVESRPAMVLTVIATLTVIMTLPMIDEPPRIWALSMIVALIVLTQLTAVTVLLTTREPPMIWALIMVMALMMLTVLTAVMVSLVTYEPPTIGAPTTMMALTIMMALTMMIVLTIMLQMMVRGRSLVRKQTTDEISIPIIVDDMKQLSNFGFSRCWYFTIECYTPSPGWVLGLREHSVPFLMIGLSGIIYRPHFRGRLFTSPQQIEDLFNGIEDDGVLHVGTADIWIPNTLIAPLLQKHELRPRGLAFRVGYDLFCAAVDFRNDRLDRKQFEEKASSMRDTMSFSGEENSAFTAWRQMQVNLAREQYPKDRELALSWSSEQRASGTQEGRDHE